MSSNNELYRIECSPSNTKLTVGLDRWVIDPSACQRILSSQLRLKSTSLFKGAWVSRDMPLSGIGAARTVICVRKEASRRDEVINIWNVLFGLSERGVG